MYRNPVTKAWEHDFRVPGMARYHISYGAIPKKDADRLHAAVSACVRAKCWTVIEALRLRQVTPELLAELHALGRPFTDALKTVEAPLQWPTMDDAIDTYCDALVQSTKKRDRTAVMARTALARFRAYLDERDAAAGVPVGTSRALRLDEIPSQLVSDYQAALFAAGYKLNTVTAYVPRVGAVFHWHLRREAREAAEQKRAPRPLLVPLDPETISTAKEHRTRYLSEAEAERLLAATPAPLLFPIAAGLFAGLRIQEMLHLRPGFDVDLRIGTLSVQDQPAWKPKTTRSRRHIPIAAALRPILERHLARYASSDWLVPSAMDPAKPMAGAVFSKHVRRIVADAELVPGHDDPEGVTYHCLRHTFASWLLMRGTDPFTVAKLLGNTVKMVEDVYSHLAKDFRQQAVDRLTFTVPALDGAA